MSEGLGFNWSKAVSMLALSSALSTAMAAGFQIQEQNVTQLGTAYTGTAAHAADASTNFYNAAGLPMIHGNQIVMAAVGIYSHSSMHITSSAVGYNPNEAIQGNLDSPGGFAPLPSFHYSTPVTNSLYFGFSMASPFGLKTEYGDDNVFRYHATRSELRTIDLAPSLAYKVNNSWSIAAGPDLMHAETHLDSAIPEFVLQNQDSDGFLRNHGDAWAWGYHFGVMYHRDSDTRFGFNYRSRFTVRAKGQAERLIPNIGNQETADVRSSVTLPESMTLSGYHKFDPKWALLFDVSYTRWRRFKELVIEFRDSLPTDPVLNAPLAGVAAPFTNIRSDVNFSSAWRYGLGLEHYYCDKIKLRAGITIDRSPVENEHRTPRIPDNNRTWFAIGAGYDYSKDLHLDLGYAFLQFSNATIDDGGVVIDSTGNRPSSSEFLNIKGEYNSEAHIFGAQLRYNFT